MGHFSGKGDDSSRVLLCPFTKMTSWDDVTWRPDIKRRHTMPSWHCAYCVPRTWCHTICYIMPSYDVMTSHHIKPRSIVWRHGMTSQKLAGKKTVKCMTTLEVPQRWAFSLFWCTDIRHLKRITYWLQWEQFKALKLQFSTKNVSARWFARHGGQGHSVSGILSNGNFQVIIFQWKWVQSRVSLIYCAHVCSMLARYYFLSTLCWGERIRWWFLRQSPDS